MAALPSMKDCDDSRAHEHMLAAVTRSVIGRMAFNNVDGRMVIRRVLAVSSQFSRHPAGALLSLRLKDKDGFIFSGGCGMHVFRLHAVQYPLVIPKGWNRKELVQTCFQTRTFPWIAGIRAPAMKDSSGLPTHWPAICETRGKPSTFKNHDTHRSSHHRQPGPTFADGPTLCG
jgi:hypothetical protein